MMSFEDSNIGAHRDEELDIPSRWMGRSKGNGHV